MPNNLTDAEENRLLDASLANGDKLALVTSASSDATAGTEVTGGSYARAALAFAAAASGSKATSSAVSFAAMPAVDVVGWEIWSADGATRKWYGLWSPKTGSAAAATDTITATAHGLADGDAITFQSGYAPAGATAGTKYFVRDPAANTFKIAASAGGSAIDLTADTATVVVGKVGVVAAGGTVNVAAGAITCSLS